MERKPKLQIFPLTMRAWERISGDLNDKEARSLWRLVARYAEQGGLPIDDKELARIARVDVRTWRNGLRRVLAIKFPQEGWRWPEIDQRIERQRKYLLKKSAAGITGNAKRWGSLHATIADDAVSKLVPIKKR